MHIGQVIYALRQGKGLTQEALALEAETVTSNLSRIEQGKSSPSIALLQRLAEALGTSVTAIFAGAEGLSLNVSSQAQLTETDTLDFSREAVQLRQGFRDLSLSNKRLTLEFVRMLVRLQQGRELP